MKKNKNGFTLVELLAVIVILAVILVIAVPRVMDVINDSKRATLESTAKMIASTAEKAKIQNTVLSNTKELECKDIVKINDVDYSSCEIEFDGNTAKVTLIGSGKFEGLNVCNGTKTKSSGVNISCSEICDTNEEQKIYNYVKEGPYQVNDIPSCISYVSTKLNAVGATDLAAAVEPICNGEEVEGYDFDGAINMLIGQGLFTEEELVDANVIKEKETEEVKVCVPKKSMNGATYLSNMVKDENAKKVFGLIKDDTPDKNIRYAGKNPANKVYFNCEAKDKNNVSYGEEGYLYKESCEEWRIIGVFNVLDGSGNIEKRMKIINTKSTFMASWDSSRYVSDTDHVNIGWGINQWGESKYSNGSSYEGADLMRLLNGYYIGKSGSTCRYCNGNNQETCEQICDTQDKTLANQKMKPLTSIAKNMVKNAVWDTYAVDLEGWHDANAAYLQEKGITAQHIGKSLCEGTTDFDGSYCNDTVNRTTSWAGLVGLMTISDVLYSNGWLYDIGEPKWTISMFSSDYYASRLYHNETPFGNDVDSASIMRGVCPSLYLLPNVQIIGGDGTNDSPFKLDI